VIALQEWKEDGFDGEPPEGWIRADVPRGRAAGGLVRRPDGKRESEHIAP